MKNVFAIIFFIALTAHATKTVAVLEIVPTNDTVELKLSEYRHLTDELRTRAREVLPRTGYTILTRDNLISLQPPDEEEARCLAESCAVEIGRAIGAEYVTQGFVGHFGEMLTLTVELYESLNGNLLGSFVTESKDIMSLLGTIRERAPGLFANIAPEPAPEPKINIEEPITPIYVPPDANKTPEPQNSYKLLAVTLTLDVIGAAMLGFGIYQHINANNLHDEYKDLPRGLPPEQYDNALQKANEALKRRDIGYAIGGTLLAAGIAVHIWF